MITNNRVYIAFNALGVALALAMLSLSVWLAPVDLSTKGYWVMGIFLMGVALVNLVQYRIDERIRQERLTQLENAKNEKILTEYIGGQPA